MSEPIDRMTTLETALAELGPSVDYPRPRAGFAAAVTAGIATPRRRRAGWPARPVRRAVLVAVALALLVAAVAGAIGLGLPGLRILLASPPPSVAPTPLPSVSAGTPPGATLGLGEEVPVDVVASRAAFAVKLPTDSAVGPPETAWLDAAKAGQVTLVWPTRPGLPATASPGVGLLLAEFDGRLDTGFFTKVAGSGTRVEHATVGGSEAYWVTGAQHFFFYTRPNGEFVEDGRRWVGDALLWSKDGITYRLETSLGREAAIRIAESVR
ncbi:MAG TPA: hypothetical protein VKA85_08680 [Candidatus Limnocylindrales bacterium]|nr:hypothetical protein [Candidatus Limnocylindrales bacterium]